MGTLRVEASYTSKIIKAGALVQDTQLFLTHWDNSVSVQENLQLIRQSNLLGKASRSRVADMLVIFRDRYLRDSHVAAALVMLAQGGLPWVEIQPILYFLSVQSDLLLRDIVLQVLFPKYQQGRMDVRPEVIMEWLQEQVLARRTAGEWATVTIERVAQGILATLRDFGVLEGAVKKHLRTPHLPPTSFVFIALLLNQKLRSGDKLLRDPAWQLFFLKERDVERLFFEAHQEGLLSYQAAGNVIRIDFPVQTMEDYALALTRRSL